MNSKVTAQRLGGANLVCFVESLKCVDDKSDHHTKEQLSDILLLQHNCNARNNI